MREVSVRMLDLYRDLARLAEIDEGALFDGLPSVAAASESEADWIDWEEFVELVERFERTVGGPEAFGRIARESVASAYPELRALATVFVRPIPFFEFVVTRMMATIFRHMTVVKLERLAGDRVRWTQTIPEPYRPCEAFHRATISMCQVFPRHLGLPEATLETASITPRSAEFVFAFPPAPPLVVRGAGAASSAVSMLAVQLDEAFAKIAMALRAEPGATGPGERGGAAASANGENGHLGDWADRLALSPRQRDVFSLLVQGRANKDIAGALRCSERNVEFHVGRILRAAGVSSRAELLVKVLGARA